MSLYNSASTLFNYEKWQFYLRQKSLKPGDAARKNKLRKYFEAGMTAAGLRWKRHTSGIGLDKS